MVIYALSVVFVMPPIDQFWSRKWSHNINTDNSFVSGRELEIIRTAELCYSLFTEAGLPYSKKWSPTYLLPTTAFVSTLIAPIFLVLARGSNRIDFAVVANCSKFWIYAKKTYQHPDNLQHSISLWNFLDSYCSRCSNELLSSQNSFALSSPEIHSVENSYQEI